MLRLISVLLFITAVNAIPVDNGVEGEPEIECGPTSITVNFNTRNPFEGHVYVKGLFDQPGCRNDEGGRQVAGIELPFDSCNVARTRSLNPRGIFVTSVVVISFHPLFVTKVDRAYRVQCFYMEADKTVSAQLEVSEMTTAFATQIVPMPVCRYEVELLNADGCALDKYLLNNLEYPTDLMAGQEAHVYKYADRSQLFYQCQISITIKEPNSECARPQCAEPQGFGAIRSRNGGAAAASRQVAALRVLKKREARDENVVDVRTDLSALDINEEFTPLPDALRHRSLEHHQYGQPVIVSTMNQGICMSLTGFTFVGMLAFAIFIVAIVVALSLLRSNSGKH
ncbi:hypothetical protein X798_05824 [Onchocerca flexuosa]|uniref:ZP domain-containing protein n=1 Tax=Onchocerca flexuosa TaxID=387005 RepID=A0A238BRI7_9BILA|nr:hypothetical protein X798_05824 [Onchocerca flexuosa]